MSVDCTSSSCATDRCATCAARLAMPCRARRSKPIEIRTGVRPFPQYDVAMKATATIGLVCLISCTSVAHAACKQGAYASSTGDYVVVVPLPDPTAAGQRYLFRDGRRGSTADAGAPVTCAGDAVTIKTERRQRGALGAATVHDRPTRNSPASKRARRTIDRAGRRCRRRAPARRHGAWIGAELCNGVPVLIFAGSPGHCGLRVRQARNRRFRWRLHAELRAAGCRRRRCLRAREDDDAGACQQSGLFRRQPGWLGCAARRDAH